MTGDDLLIAALHLAASRDPVPGHVTGSARDAYRLRVPGAVTARPIPAPPPIGTRAGTGDCRRLRYAADGLIVDMEVVVGAGAIDMAGRVSPHPGPGGHLEIRTLHDTHPRPLPDTGQFAACGLPPGWYSIVCHRDTRPPVATTWTRLGR
ncbi:hypothetical protein DP939_13620 [Spongiactinospora rosea]|uniref:Uncharacterized protein n=1 Tax=Spongiactinospora rosea TaxID=2248750 RepID=A0A366M1S1_9ACTN|nr:hypothetical protein [Spongiactinospora rosea]RBQ19753.1 hypothetical protein DP939_13620 [Spongiactinospora rosea]